MADEVIDPGVKWLLDQVPKASLPEVLQIPEPETGKLKNIALIFKGELWLVFLIISRIFSLPGEKKLHSALKFDLKS